MAKTLMLVVALAGALSGCTDSQSDEIPDQDLSSVQLAADLHFTAASELMFSLSRFGVVIPPHAAKREDCVRIHPSATLVVNGAAATLVSDGAWVPAVDTETSCTAPLFTAAVDPAAIHVDLVLADTSATEQFALDETNGTWAVTRCDASACTFH